MVFSEYVNKLPNLKQETINKLAEITSSTTMTVYRWINGSVTPPMVKKKIIAEYLKMDIDDLWPEDKEDKEIKEGGSNGTN